MTVCGVLHRRMMSFCCTVRLSVLAAGFVPHAGLLLSALSVWGVRLVRLVTCVSVCLNTSSKAVSAFASVQEQGQDGYVRMAEGWQG